MPRKYFKRFLPDHDTILQSRWLRPFGARLQHPNLWHLHRRSVAGGVGIGMFAGLIPGPFQMIGAALLAVLFRANLPVAMFTTLYTNPFTIAPLYFVAYELGAFVTGHHDGVNSTRFALPDLNWGNWFSVLFDWFASLGKPFAIGLPLLAVTLGIVGYFAVRVFWYVMVVVAWRRRAVKRAKGTAHNG
jgi:uncharacterized protein (DUF2062 family)